MILLLPLRVWAGGAMSVTMALDQAMLDGDVISMPAGCAMQGQSNGDAFDGDQTAPTGSACDSCHLCLPFTPAAAIGVDKAVVLPHAKPLSPDSEPPSASLAPSFKPPIS